eukprot:m51a1_g8741 hypothetical protein (265) ;mRNA; f:33806-34857
MEIAAELTPAVEALLGSSFPDSLCPRHALRMGTVSSLVADDPCSPSFLLATIQREGLASRDGKPVRPVFVAATDYAAAARALPQGGRLQLAALPEPLVDAIVRARPDAVDPRPNGFYLLHSVPEPVELPDGAHVRRLRREDAGQVFGCLPPAAGMSLASIERFIELTGGCGVETQSGDLVAWMLRCPLIAALAMGHTLEQHRRRGYARAVLREVLRQQKADGQEQSFFYVPRGNAAMLELGASEDFQRADGLRYWMLIQGTASA